MLDPRGIMDLRARQMNLLKMHQIDFRRVMDVYMKFEARHEVSAAEEEMYDNAIEILRQRNCLDFFLERFSRKSRTTAPKWTPPAESAPAEVPKETPREPAEEGVANASRFSLAMHRLDHKESTWLVGVLDKFLKTNKKMDNRISLEFNFIEKQKGVVVGKIIFLAWSSHKLEMPVTIGTRNNMLFIQGSGLDVVFDSEGQINILDISCLRTLKEKAHAAAGP